MCACVRALSMCHQFIFVVALHFGLFYLTNYKGAVFFCLRNLFPCVCVCVSMIILHCGCFLHCWKCATSFLSMCVLRCFFILRMNFVQFLCGVSSYKIIQNEKPPQQYICDTDTSTIHTHMHTHTHTRTRTQTLKIIWKTDDLNKW